MGRALELLVQNVLEVHPAPLKARGVDVGNVIAHHIHSGLMIL
jgi:hypothetical protein